MIGCQRKRPREEMYRFSLDRVVFYRVWDYEPNPNIRWTHNSRDFYTTHKLLEQCEINNIAQQNGMLLITILPENEPKLHEACKVNRLVAFSCDEMVTSNEYTWTIKGTASEWIDDGNYGLTCRIEWRLGERYFTLII